MRHVVDDENNFIYLLEKIVGNKPLRRRNSSRANKMKMNLTQINLKNWIELAYLHLIRGRFEHNHKYALHEHTVLFGQFIYRSADKSLARPGRKKATATKL